MLCLYAVRDMMATPFDASSDLSSLSVLKDLQFEDERPERLGKSRAATTLQASHTVRMLCSASDPQQVDKTCLSRFLVVLVRILVCFSPLA